MKNLEIKSIREAREKRNFFDKICLIQSWGKEIPLLSYDGLGLGNLLAAYIGALLIDEDINVVNFYDVRIAPYQWLIRKPRYWFNRSSFKILNFSNNYNRIVYFPKVTTQSYINIQKKVLYLSTNLVNYDKNYFKDYGHLNKDKLEKRIKLNFGLNFLDINKYKNSPSILGVHMRQGDFTYNEVDTNQYQSNMQTSLNQYIYGVSSILNKHDCDIVRIFSDEKIKDHEKNKISNFVSHNRKKVKVQFQAETSAIEAINKMMQSKLLLISNSTFSFWASALKNIKTYYLLDNLPYDSPKYFKNMVNINLIRKK